jgi:hypothetical protein
MATNENESTTNPTSGTSDSLGQMADLLLDGLEPESEEEDELLTDDSNEDEEQPEEEGEQEEEQEATWATALGVDDDKVIIDEDGNLEGIKVKIDKEELVVPVAELIAGYQTSKSYTQKTQKLAEQKKEFESIRDYAATEYTKKLEDVTKLSAVLEQELVKDYAGIDWDTLRVHNPGEYAAMVQDFQIKQQRVAAVKQAIEQERIAEMQRGQQFQFQGTREYLEGEMHKILEKNPTWSKPENFKRDITEIKSFVAEAYGFNEDEFNNISDSRIFEVLKDAIAYRKGSQSVQTKMVKTIPKFQKPGNAKAAKKATALDKLTKAAQGAKPGKQKRDLEQNAIAALLLGQ